jgi:hypothetical protein
VRTFIVCLAAVVSLSCSRDAPSGPTPAEMAAARADASSDAGKALAASAARELTRDYRGTLGQRTSIAVHLVRAGRIVSGFYVYTEVGTLIPLSGSVDAGDAGAEITLTETSARKATGTFHLHPSGDDLVGEWKSAKGNKAFPVRLSLGEPWAVATSDAGGRPEERAEQCLADPLCPAAEADRLFVAAEDAHSAGVDCFRFLDGDGTKRDPVRGRACLERSVGSGDCGGSSAGLDRAELALLLIDGVGGAPDIPRARALFAGCFADVTASGVLAHADAKEHDPKALAVNFCKDQGGTTLTSNECAVRARTIEETRADLAAKALASSLDEASVRAFDEASKAYAVYVSAMGAYAYEVYIEGSIRNGMALAREQELYRTRAKELGELGRFVVAETEAADVASAETRTRVALAAIPVGTPAEKAALDKTQTTWSAYRDAEVRFYALALGPKQGADRVERAERVRLETRRAKECAPPSARGN